MASPTGSCGSALEPDMVGPYLARIGHGPVTVPTVEALGSLQDAHVRSVPFENLDIHLGRPLSLEVGALATKVVERRRGGFCYELNGLFAALLAALGFDARLVEARARDEGGTLGARFDHARILVGIGQRLVLVDAGTGASPRGPIELDETPQQVGSTWYRVRRRSGRFESETLEGDAWTPEWSFDAVARRLDEFVERCRFHEQSPDSHFTRKPICTLVTEGGHVTLADRLLIETEAGERHEQAVEDPLAVLAQRFGVEIPCWPGS